jgi:diguanylate cyclase (GGDEF)-like protein
VVLLIALLILYRKYYLLLKIFSNSKIPNIAVVIWEREKLIFHTPNLYDFLKSNNIDHGDLKKVSEESLKLLQKKYPFLEDFLKEIQKNYHSDSLFFDKEIIINNNHYIIKFNRLILNKKKYNVAYIINITENINYHNQKLISPILNFPPSLFEYVTNTENTAEIIKKLYNHLKSNGLVDSIVFGLKEKDGSVIIPYAFIDGEEILNLKIPFENKSLTSYIIDSENKMYIKDSQNFNLPKGYTLKSVGEKRTVSIYGVPLRFNNNVFGAVLFKKAGIDMFNSNDFYVFDILANLIATNYKIKEYIEKLNLEKEKNFQNSLLDPLTGAYNRNFFEHYLSKILEETKRFNSNNSIVFLDLDNFKQINDSYGHHYGDELLKQFVITSKKSLRKMDVLVRYGGDEFLIILPKSGLKNSENVVKRLEKNLLKFDPPIEFSYGIVEITPDKSHDELLKQVDNLMYSMKEKKKKLRDKKQS